MLLDTASLGIAVSVKKCFFSTEIPSSFFLFHKFFLHTLCLDIDYVGKNLLVSECSPVLLR